MKLSKGEQLRLFEDALRGAVLACQDMELLILERQEGRLSSDFMFFERQESYLVDVQQRIERYRARLPEAHPLYKANERQTAG